MLLCPLRSLVISPQPPLQPHPLPLWPHSTLRVFTLPSIPFTSQTPSCATAFTFAASLFRSALSLHLYSRFLFREDFLTKHLI